MSTITTTETELYEMSTPPPSDIPSCQELALIVRKILNEYGDILPPNTSSVKKLEDANTKHAETTEKTSGAILQHVKSIEERVKDIEGQTLATTELIEEIDQIFGPHIDSACVLEKHLGSIEKHISSIERLIVRSRKRKLNS